MGHSENVLHYDVSASPEGVTERGGGILPLGGFLSSATKKATGNHS